MRILMVTNMYPTTDDPGRGIFVKSQIDSIVAQGIDVDIWTIHGHLSKMNYLRALVEVRRRVGRTHYDLIHAHYGLSGLATLGQLRTPLVVSFCGDDLLGTPCLSRGTIRKAWPSRIIVWADIALACHADAVIVKSREMRQVLPSFLWPRCHVIPNGVDFKIFRPMPKEEARASLGLRLDREYVLFPSAPQALRKRLDVAQAAISTLQAQGRSVELLVVRGQFQEQLVLYMNACDALVLTSMWEGSPNVIKEAMACNLPVVAVDVGDVREVVGSCPGCHVTGREPQAIAQALEQVLASGTRTPGRSLIPHLRLEVVAERVIDVYRRVLAHRPIRKADHFTKR